MNILITLLGLETSLLDIHIFYKSEALIGSITSYCGRRKFSYNTANDSRDYNIKNLLYDYISLSIFCHHKMREQGPISKSLITMKIYFSRATYYIEEKSITKFYFMGNLKRNVKGKFWFSHLHNNADRGFLPSDIPSSMLTFLKSILSVPSSSSLIERRTIRSMHKNGWSLSNNW